ncbi:hypothetical protein CISIN_1g045094mg, partial [Citrus sinensis]
DVFSFGVLLLETPSKKKNTHFYDTDALTLGHASVWNLWSDGRAWELKGPILENEASYPILKRYMNMVLLSVGENATDRPAMSELVSMHSNEVANLLSPKQPAFFIC